MDVALRVNVMVLTLDPNGAVEQVTALGATSVSAASVTHRLEDVEHYGDVWGWTRNGVVLARPAANSVRFRLATGAPLAAQEGELVRTTEAGGATVRLRGVAGAFAGEEQRWDVVPHPGGTFVMLTTGSQEAHVNWMQHALIDRDAWVVPGLSAYWDVVAVRYGLAGLR
jgi:hypothetical protein